MSLHNHKWRFVVLSIDGTEMFLTLGNYRSNITLEWRGNMIHVGEG